MSDLDRANVASLVRTSGHMAGIVLDPMWVLTDEEVTMLADPLATVLAKHAPGASEYAPEIALLGATATIVTRRVRYKMERDMEDDPGEIGGPSLHPDRPAIDGEDAGPLEPVVT